MSANAVLPELPLSSLREKTKDFLLAFCQKEGCTPDEAIRRVIDASADRQMPPPPATGSQSEAATVPMAA